MNNITKQLADTLRNLLRCSTTKTEWGGTALNCGQKRLTDAIEALAAYDAQKAEPIEGEWEGSADDDRVIFGKSNAKGVAYRVCVADTEEDAHRIVACVNACTGIPNEVLRPGIVAEYQRNIIALEDQLG